MCRPFWPSISNNGAKSCRPFGIIGCAERAVPAHPHRREVGDYGRCYRTVSEWFGAFGGLGSRGAHYFAVGEVDQVMNSSGGVYPSRRQTGRVSQEEHVHELTTWSLSCSLTPA